MWIRMSASLTQLVDTLAARLRREEGQTMAEYALLLGLILVVTAVVVAALGTQIKGVFNSVTSAL
jgi:pilus assembly protein Flp/PilA